MNTLNWEKYESVTKYIYETLGKDYGVTIVGCGSNFKITGKSGVKHQVDVLTSQTNGIHSTQTAIECKYHKNKVSKDPIMKLSETIKDSGIEKGIIVSRSGFTDDAIAQAKFLNIGLVELREIEDKDFLENPKQIEIADINIHAGILRTRAEIIKIDIGNNRTIEIKDEIDYLDYYDFSIINKEGNSLAFINYLNDFRKKVSQKSKMYEIITKKHDIYNSTLLNMRTNESFKIDEIIFTGRLTEKDLSKSLKLTLVDEVWLIMKSIFDEKIFSFSENGVIKENTNYKHI
jgi:hypothetical protein